MIRRYYATKDNTITNAFKENLQTRATGSNMGASDILETFSIYNQVSNSSGISSELARILIEFDTDQISSDRTAKLVPSSGSVSWFLKMYNTPHSQTTPTNFSLIVSAVSASWQEGFGMDMDFYEDETKNSIGSNWIRRSGSTSWTSAGGDYVGESTKTQTFSTGFEDLEVDVTKIVERWLGNDWTNYGFGIKLTTALEQAQRSYYRKKFYGRDSEFFFRKPVLEARWDSARKDDRGYFYASSSLVPPSDNLNTLYLYNRVRGRLRDYPIAPTSASIRVSTHIDTQITSAPVYKLADTTGIYFANIAVETTASTVRDIWHSGSVGYHTGTVAVKTFAALGYNPEDTYVLSMPSLRKEYRKSQTHRLNLYVRQKNWSPNIHTQAVRSSIPSLIIPSASYQLRRSIDDLTVVPYGTASTTMHTQLSYDVSGNYFDLDTTYLEAGYLYDIQYSFYDEENGWEEQPYKFKFRVVD